MPESVGDTLRRSREERNITLEEVAQSTHIRERYLEALENDQRQAIPSAVQARGFLRLYADYLGLEAQALLDDWAGIIPFTPATPPITSEADSQPAQELPPPPLEVSVQAVEQEIPGAAIAQPESTSPTTDGAADSYSIFNQVGADLKLRRESLSLSLGDVERYTHVKQHYLEAIEDGRINDLPSPVQGRGMLNNYARFLDMDSDQILLRFADGLQTQRVERLDRTTGKRKKRSPARQARPTFLRQLATPDLLIGGAVILALFLIAIWAAAQVSGQRRMEAEATAPSIAEVLLNSTEVSTGTPAAEADFTATPPEAIALSEPGAAEPEIDPVETGPSADLPVLAENPNAPLQVYVVAHQRAWMRVTTDNQIVFNGRVVAGNAYAFSGDQAIQLLTGNGAGLQVYFNQGDLGILGIVGQIVEMTFTADGVITPTPAASPTPTVTATPEADMTEDAMMEEVPTATVTPYIPE